MGSHAVVYYSSLYHFDQTCIQTGLIDRVVPQLVIGEKNDMLLAIPLDNVLSRTSLL